MKRLFVVLLLVVLTVPLFTGCGATDMLGSLFKPKKAAEQSVDESIINPAADIYVDSKTGLIITKRQYNVYRFVDGYKKYGGYVAIFCFVVGLLLRLFVRTSMAVKKFSTVLLAVVPVIFIVLAYVFSYLGDKA